MLIRHNGKMVVFRHVKSPRYIVRVGFDVFTADKLEQVSTLLESFVSFGDLSKVEIFELSSVRRFSESLDFTKGN